MMIGWIMYNIHILIAYLICLQWYATESMKALSSFVNNPSKAGSELRPCLVDAQRYVPRKDLSRTPVFLGATAGMRLLKYD